MLEVEKKIALVKSWIDNLEFSNGKLDIKYIIDKKIVWKLRFLSQI